MANECSSNLEVLGTDQRRAERSLAWISRVTVAFRDKPPVTASMLDLSLTGCRLRLPVTAEAGEQVMVRLPGPLDMPATLMWCHHGEAGCRFDGKVPPDLVRRVTLPSF